MNEKEREIRFTYYVDATYDVAVEQILGYGALG